MKLCWVIALLIAFCAACLAQDPPPPMCRPHTDNGNCATNPKLIHNVSPQFSEYARKKKITGSVQLKLTVRPDGTTSDIVVTRSLEKSLDAQAIKAVQQWQFEPSTYRGEPVAVTISAEVNFRLY